MEDINACPHHGYATWMIVDYFYEGISLDHKRLVESMNNGPFLTKNGDKAVVYLNQVAEMSKGWEVSQLKDMGHDTSSGNALEQSLLKLASKVDDFVGEQRGINKQLSLRMDSMEKSQNGMVRKMDNMQNILSKFSNSHTSQEKRRFPSQPQQNMGGMHEVAANEGKLENMGDIKAIMTLRNDKQINQPFPPFLHEEGDAKNYGKKMKRGQHLNKTRRRKLPRSQRSNLKRLSSKKEAWNLLHSQMHLKVKEGKLLSRDLSDTKASYGEYSFARYDQTSSTLCKASQGFVHSEKMIEY